MKTERLNELRSLHITSIRNSILEQIAAERSMQDKKWGFPQHNSLSEWGNILGEEYGEYLKALNEHIFGRTANPDDMVNELIQTAAVAVAILEHLELEGGIRPNERD